MALWPIAQWQRYLSLIYAHFMGVNEKGVIMKKI